MEHELEGTDVVILSVLVLYVGNFLTRKIPFLKKYNIPSAVTGGLICSGVVAAIFSWTGTKITFDLAIRDLLLLVFFSTIGLGAKFKVLAAGGKLLAILVVAAFVFLVLQDLTGVLMAKLMGANPGLGLFGGSISFAGGHGTAIAWGQEATKAGIVGAAELGIACATFGLIAGGLIGGPIAQRLINKHNLKPTGDTQPEKVAEPETRPEQLQSPILIKHRLDALLVIAICVGLGDTINRWLFSEGVMLPGFLTAMFVGILITNFGSMMGFQLNESVVSNANELSLQLFLAMSLMSMQLWMLAKAIGPILLVVFAQGLVITIFATFIVFRLMGRNYDAAVISAGFCGLGLGATPIAIANMSAVTGKYGPSPKAFIVVPLVGAFFIDIMNAVVIKYFIASPLLQGSAPAATNAAL